jgi:peptidoglycan/LPS O-acetylase OafA/YrhL
MDKNTTQTNLDYLPNFDGLRVFAIFFVMILHGGYGYFKGGWIGVDIFFVISGYLITSLLAIEHQDFNSISLSKFYWRRTLRLFPPLLICVILANVLWPYTQLNTGGDQSKATFAALFYYTNVVAGNVSGNMFHLWSLCVEEHFYVLWPIVLSYGLLKLPLRKRIIILSIAIVLLSALRIVFYQFADQLIFGIYRINTYSFTFCRMDGILTGALLAFILSQRSRQTSKFFSAKNSNIFLLLFFTAYIVILFTLSPDNYTWNNGGFVFTNLLCSATVLVAIKAGRVTILSNRVIDWVSKRSYGIYIYHFPIFLILERLRVPHSISNLLLITALRFALSIALASLSYQYMELPLSKFKKGFSIRRRRRNKAARPDLDIPEGLNVVH